MPFPYSLTFSTLKKLLYPRGESGTIGYSYYHTGPTVLYGPTGHTGPTGLTGSNY